MQVQKNFIFVLKVIKVIAYSFVFLLAAVILFSIIPAKKNYRFLAVKTGSMEPTIYAGSLVVIKPAADYQVGDIATYKPHPKKDEQTLVTHRIYAIQQIGKKKVFIFKGDANNAPDLNPVKQENIVGKIFIKIPLIGYPISYAQTRIGWIILIIIPAAIIVYREITKICYEVKRIKARSNSGLQAKSETSSNTQSKSQLASKKPKLKNVKK